MKRHTPATIAVFSCLLTAICLFQIAALKDEIRNVQSSLNAQMGDVNSTVRNTYSNIDSLLKKQASLLSGSGYEYGGLNTDKMTVELSCSVTPREFSPAGTTAVLVLNGREYPMTLKSGAFSVTLALPLFVQNEIPKVQFAEGGVLRTEALDWILTPRYEFLPNVFASLSGSASGRNSLRRKGTVDINVDGASSLEIKSISLIGVLDGKEINRTSIKPNENADIQGYIPAEPAPPVDITSSGRVYHGSYELDETYEIPNGSTHELYIEVVDGYDLHYRVLIDRFIVDKNGNPGRDENEWMWRGTEADICDASGNILYGIDRG